MKKRLGIITVLACFIIVTFGVQAPKPVIAQESLEISAD